MIITNFIGFHTYIIMKTRIKERGRGVDINQMLYLYRDKLYRLCLYLEKNILYAEELFQDTWVKALENVALYDEAKAFYPWLSKIAVNLYRDRLRRIKREFKTIIWSQEEEDYEDQNANIEAKVLKDERHQALRHAIGKLDDKYKLPLVLAYQEELSYAEISKILGIKESTVKSRIYDGKQKLKRYLEKEGFYE